MSWLLPQALHTCVIPLSPPGHKHFCFNCDKTKKGIWGNRVCGVGSRIQWLVFSLQVRLSSPKTCFLSWVVREMPHECDYLDHVSVLQPQEQISPYITAPVQNTTWALVPSALSRSSRTAEGQPEGASLASQPAVCHLVAFLNSKSRKRMKEKAGIPTALEAFTPSSNIKIKGCHFSKC